MANSIERSIQLLTLLATNQAPTTVSEVAVRLNTSVPSASRMVQTLTEAGAIRRDVQSGRFEISVGLAQVGAAALRSLAFRRAALPVIAGAISELRRPVNIGVPDRDNAIWLESVTFSGNYTSSTLMGVAIPYHAATMGKVLLAFMPPADVERIIGGNLHRYTEATLIAPESLRAELALIRDCGFAINRGEFRENGLAVAVPLIDSLGQPVAAFSVPATQDELEPTGDLVRKLRHLTGSIAQQLGYADESLDSFV